MLAGLIGFTTGYGLAGFCLFVRGFLMGSFLVLGWRWVRSRGWASCGLRARLWCGLRASLRLFAWGYLRLRTRLLDLPRSCLRRWL